MEKFRYLPKEKINNLPKAPGVYLFKKGTKLLYLGKAADIRKRVKSHFSQPTSRHNLFINQVSEIGYLKTNSEIEALISEANLIKKYQPPYNIVWRDDKNYFFVGVTKEDFPRIFLTHQAKKIQPRGGKKKKKIASKLQIEYIGPFVDGKALKQTLKILRGVFPYRSCRLIPHRPCLWYHLNRCLAPCLLKSKFKIPPDYLTLKEICQKNIQNLIKIFKEGKNPVLKTLKKEMKLAAKKQDFEKAAKIRDQIKTLEKVMENARIFSWEITQITPGEKSYSEIEKELGNLLKTKKKISRIEAYDISNIQGQQATGSMVTFIEGQAIKNFYRKFKIKIQGKPNDVAMIRECLIRRFRHQEWGLPDLILIDGGKAQLKAAQQSLGSNLRKIKVMALAKKRNELYLEREKNPIFLKDLSPPLSNLILKIRDQAHRFAKKYHLKLRELDLRKSF